MIDLVRSSAAFMLCLAGFSLMVGFTQLKREKD